MDTTERALTIRQPWAWAVLSAGKMVENRARQWRYRGRVAIHAGTAWSESGGRDERVIDAWIATANAEARYAAVLDLLGRDLSPAEFARGAIIGTADLTDAHPDAGCCRPWGESRYVEHGGHVQTIVAHLRLENPRRLVEPIPCRGRLGLWTLPPICAELAGAVYADRFTTANTEPVEL